LSPNSKAKLEAEKLLLANSSPKTNASTKRVNGEDTDPNCNDRNNKNGELDPFAIDTKRVNWADKDSQELDSAARAARAANALKMGLTDPNMKNRINLNSGGQDSLHASKTPITSSSKFSKGDYGRGGLHDTDDENMNRTNRFKNFGRNGKMGDTNPNSHSALRTTCSTKKSNVSKFLTKSQINDYDMNAYL
jgi:hypothetical protein